MIYFYLLKEGISMSIYSYDININFSDVDKNNQMSNKGILRLMQEVAGICSGSLGYGVNDVPKTGLAWLILNWKLQIFSRPRTNTKLTINTWTRSENPLFSYRDFEVYDNDILVAKASSKWVLFDVNKKCITKITPEHQEKYSCIDKFAFDDNSTKKLKEPKNSELIMDYNVQRRDIDTNHHVNNLIYLDYAYEALPEDIYSNLNFSNVEIMYKHEAKLGDALSLFYTAIEENEYIVTIKNKQDNKLNAIVKLYN